MIILIGILMILLAGLGNPLQTAINGRLRGYVHIPLVASTVSFTVGTVSLLVLTLAMYDGQLVPYDAMAIQPWWIWLGGLMGVIGLTGNIVLFPKLGSVQTALMPTMGQIVMSMLIDHFGWLGVAENPFDGGRVTGLLLVAVGLAVYMKGKHGSGKSSGWLWPLAGVVFGTTFAIQPAMNGQLSLALGSSIYSAFISFASATVVLYLLVLSRRADRVEMGKMFSHQMPWWTWTGGLLGAFYVTMFAWFTPMLGVGILSLVSILGMLAMSVLIDARGWIGAPVTRISWMQYAGLALMLAGIVAIKLTTS